jgi:hypothetical protein
MIPLAKIFLFLLGAVAAFFAMRGYKRGRITCKGVTYERATSPLGFWASIAAFAAWALMMGYFVFFVDMSKMAH